TASDPKSTGDYASIRGQFEEFHASSTSHVLRAKRFHASGQRIRIARSAGKVRGCFRQSNGGRARNVARSTERLFFGTRGNGNTDLVGELRSSCKGGFSSYASLASAKHERSTDPQRT